MWINLDVINCISSTRTKIFFFKLTVTTHPSEVDKTKVLGVGGLGGLYPALHKFTKCHYNGTIYDNGDIVSC